MKRINHRKIKIPIEFSVACAISKMKIAEVLQVFVDHVTLYDTLSGDYNKGFSEAVGTITSCVREKTNPVVESKAMRNCRELVVTCLSKIEVLAKKKVGLTSVKKWRARRFVTKIFETMERKYTIIDTIYLDECSAIKLGMDFCILCEVHNCYPREFLEHFMGKISLADAHAHKGLNLSYDNFTFSLFSNISDGFGRDTTKMFNLTDFEVDFYERMDVLYLELYIIRDLQDRATILRDFYLSHYQIITQN